jgi:RNA polymerase sigma-70 factor (ECF subfamily)
MAETSDRELVIHTRRGDAEAYGQLVERYQTSVYNVCYRFMGQRQGAEDRTQEAFLRAYQRLETFDLERPFGPWIRRVAANLCLNVLKRRGPDQVELDEERDPGPSGGWMDPERSVQRAERADMVRAALLQLPPHHRAVVELRHYQEMSYKEISAEMDMTVNEVRSNLYRARKSLAEILEGRDV